MMDKATTLRKASSLGAAGILGRDGRFRNGTLKLAVANIAWSGLKTQEPFVSYSCLHAYLFYLRRC